MLCEATPAQDHQVISESRRSSVTLHYLPLAVCQFDIKGGLMYQNPEANHVFGHPKAVLGKGRISIALEPMALTTKNSQTVFQSNPKQQDQTR